MDFAKYRLTLQYVGKILTNLKEFNIDPEKILNIEIEGKKYEISTEHYYAAYYQAIEYLGNYHVGKNIKYPTLLDLIIEMFNNRLNINVLNLTCDFQNMDSVKNDINLFIENINTNFPFAYFIFSLTVIEDSKEGHKNVMIVEYDTGKKKLLSWYYNPGGRKVSKDVLNLRTFIEDILKVKLTSEIKSVDISETCPVADGIQGFIDDKTGHCTVVSYLWVYVILNLIYSKSFNIKMKHILKPKNTNTNLFLGKKKISNVEKYIKKASLRRSEKLRIDFYTSIEDYIQPYLEEYIVRVLKKPENKNIIYNFVNLLIEYNISKNKQQCKVNDKHQEAFSKLLEQHSKWVSKPDRRPDYLEKLLLSMRNVKEPCRYFYSIKLFFVDEVIRRKYIKEIHPKNRDESCDLDSDCEGNLECIDNRCIDYEDYINNE